VKNGTFIFASWRDNRAVRIRVRECPNPPVVIAMLEQRLGRPVRFEEAPRGVR
jgi:hypothetical protein